MMKKVGVSQDANDYAANRAKIAGSPSQSVKKEEGNNSGDVSGTDPKEGEIDIKGGASYMEGFPADQAGK